MFRVTPNPGTGERPRHRVNTLMSGLALSVGALLAMGVAAVACTIQSISVTNDCFAASTSGVLTVDNAPAGDQVTLEIFAFDHSGQSIGVPDWAGNWVGTGAETTVTLVRDQTAYPYTISGLAAKYLGSPYEYLQVQVSATRPWDGFSGTSVTSGKFNACTPPVIAESPLNVILPVGGLLLVVAFISMTVVIRRRSGAAV